MKEMIEFVMSIDPLFLPIATICICLIMFVKKHTDDK
jgi:hypothetical protein